MIRDYLKHIALNLVGTPYRWGGDNPMEGMDCSGMIGFLLRPIGILPYDMTAQGIADYLLPMSKMMAACGSIACYGKDASHITHVSFCLDDKYCIEAYGDSDVKTPEDALSWRDGALIRLSLIRGRKDFLYALLPRY